MIIKTERSRLARLIDTLLTLAAWALMLWLIAKSLLDVTPAQMQAALPSIQLAKWTAGGALGAYLLVALFNALLLISWARYNQLRFARRSARRAFPPTTADDMHRSFGISAEQLRHLRMTRLATVEHMSDGGIAAVRSSLALVA